MSDEESEFNDFVDDEEESVPAPPEHANNYLIEGKGPGTVAAPHVETVLHSVDWPYSVQIQDVTYEGGVMLAHGAPYEDNT